MAKKVKNPLGYKPMPKHDGQRVGCKVGWCYYKDEKVAREAAKIAQHNARIAASEGYDFGYCSPGSVTKVGPDAKGDWLPFIGMWEVCVS